MMSPIKNYADYCDREAEAVALANTEPEPGTAEHQILNDLLVALKAYRDSLAYAYQERHAR